ncbi:MAG: tetratricopeptide repeat protein [Pyrinomonadaceae bacterium]|nr:tetratricopeptide repeat protein [Sphingobacteriaceae bacterium]
MVFCLPVIGMAQKKNAPVIVVGRVLNGSDSIKVKEYFYSALQEKAKQNLTEAGSNLKQVLEIDPSNDAALYELSSIYHSQSQEAEAENLSRQAVTVKPDNKWYWLLLADIYKKTRNLDQLILVFNELIRLNPQDEDYYFDKANALFILNKNDEAEKVYGEIEKRFGGSIDLTSARQRIYQKQGKSDKASSELEDLISINPNDIRNYLNLSDLYLKAGNFNKSLEVLNKAKAINADDSFIRLALADTYKAQGKSAEAFSELKKAFADPLLNIDAKVQILLSFFSEFKQQRSRMEATELATIATQVHPTNPKAFAVYGDILFQDKKFNEAKTAYKKALSFDSQKYLIWEQLLSIEIGLKDYSGAIADGEEALTFFPNQAPLYLYTAIAYAQIQKHDKAVSYLKNALSLEVEDKPLLSQLYSSLGDSYNSLKKYKESDQAYEKALQIDPDNTFVLNNYAYYLSVRKENLAKAASMSKRSNELQAGNASFLDTYAWVLFMQKNYKEARIWMEKALKINPENTTQLDHYGDILFLLGEKDLALEQWKLAKLKGLKSETLDKKIYEKNYIE